MSHALLALSCIASLGLSACHTADSAAFSKAAGDGAGAISATSAAVSAPQVARETAPPFAIQAVAVFDEPWAMAFLPDGRALVTEKKGALKLLDIASGKQVDVRGVPAVDYGGQGGFADVALHPQFARNGLVYVSYAEAGDGDTRGAAVARGKFVSNASGAALQDVQVIWRQVPKVSGRGHYSHRLLFGSDGKLWIGSSERQTFDPAQDMQSNLGKVLRLEDDGSVPADNPFADKGGVTAQVWLLGHRNILGLAFDAQGRLWEEEMGPKGGDELNLVERGGNYGYPVVSNGDHYDGKVISDHDTRPEFVAPKAWWNPVVSPSSLMIYSGTQFPDWRGDTFIGGPSSEALVRVEFDGDTAKEAARYPMGARIRAVDQGPDGAIWLLEDGAKGRLLKLTPRA